MKKQFKVPKGCRIPQRKAQKYGTYLWKLKEQNGNVLTPEHVVKKAKVKSSPLHDYFEWDDTVAGHNYRIWQARYLMGKIEVVVKYDDSTDQVRAFHNIIATNEGESEQGYVTVENVCERGDYLEIVLKNALDEIIRWKEKYKQYSRFKEFRSLKGVFDVVGELDND